MGSHSIHIRQLGQILADPATLLDEKIVVVPAKQSGHELLLSVALNGYPWLNARAIPLGQLARETVRQFQGSGSGMFLSDSGMALVVEQLIRQMKSGQALQLPYAARAVTRTVKELRLAEVHPEAFLAAASGRFSTTIAAVYRLYLEYLTGSGKLDEAGIYTVAGELLMENTGTIEDSESANPRVVVVLDEVILSSSAQRFLESFAPDPERRWRIGRSRPEQRCPRRSAANRLSNWRIPIVVPPVNPTETVPVYSFSAIGTENEVRACFRSIIERSLPFDRVEIAYTANSPYLSIIRSMSNRYGIPCTLAAGIRATDTRVGQIVRLFLEWIQDGQSCRKLSELFRSGLVDLRGPRGEAACHTTNPIADILAAESGACSIEGLAGIVDRLERRSREQTKGDSDFLTGHHIGYIQSYRILLEPFIENAELPMICRLSDLVDRIRHLIELYLAPPPTASLWVARGQRDPEETVVDQADVDQAELDRVSRRETMSRLEQLVEQINPEMSRSVLIRFVLEMLDGMYFRARAASAGKIHVVPVSSASLTGRAHLFIVGLDDQTMGRSVVEDPLLPDSTRTMLHTAGHGSLALAGDDRELGSWHLSRAIARTAGSITLVWNRYEPIDERVRFPSSDLIRLLHERGARTESAPLNTTVPSHNDDATSMPLDRTEFYLAARGVDDVQQDLAQEYPAITAAASSIGLRDLELWSTYDGYLQLPDAALPAFPGQIRYSASRLETFAKCPYKYFLRYLLHLRSPDDISDLWISPVEKGLMVHDIFRRFILVVQRDGGTVVPAHRSVLTDIVNEQLARFKEQRVPSLPSDERVLRRELEDIADHFFAQELDRSTDLTPEAVELGFGLKTGETYYSTDRAEPMELDVGNLRVLLRGRIDRVDRNADGDLIVTDYKTGTSHSFNARDPINDGKTLQAVVYALVAERLFGSRVAASGYYFAGISEQGKRVDADPALSVQALEDVLSLFHDMADSGFYPPAPDESGACIWCDYNRICGPISKRKRQIDGKVAATGPEEPLFSILQRWSYSRKRVGAV